MDDRTDRLAEARARYARMLAVASQSSDPRLERVFELVPREGFLPPGPWRMLEGYRYVETPNADPIHLYQNTLVALNSRRGINNGEPVLHAAWIGAVAPRPGETAVHIGAGGGYYTAMLSLLVLPGGKVAGLRDRCRTRQGRKAQPRTVRQCDGRPRQCGRSQIEAIRHHLRQRRRRRAACPMAAKPEVWRTHHLSLASDTDDRPCHSATRSPAGFSVRIVGSSWFIPCSGASDATTSIRRPSIREARKTRSIVLASERAPDESATAIYPELWFSSEPVA